MNSLHKRIGWMATGFLWAALSGIPALADDTELFIGATTPGGGVQPNILFVLDTSTSMGDEITTQPPFNPATTYAGSCSNSRVYWRNNSGNPPNCGTSQYVEASYMACDAAQTAFDAGTTYTAVIAQWDSVQNGGFDTAFRWEGLRSGRTTDYIECEEDSGIHGDGVSGTDHYATNVAAAMWTADSNDEVSWTSNPTNSIYTLYTGNYLNWYYGTTTTQEKIDILKEVTTGMLNGITGVNVGLMRFNTNEGGTIIHEMADVATNRSSLISMVNGLPANGWTPLSETLYEAGLYFRGASIDYGDAQGPAATAPGARAGLFPPASGIYNSPITDTCQQNYIVMITDGMPTQDVGAGSDIISQPNYGTVVGGGSCGSGDGACLPEAAEYLYGADLIADATLSEQQNVVTYTVGFDIDFDLLQETADAGGGQYFVANDSATLSTALTNIVAEILDTSATFSAPTVSVNSFNRTRNLNDLFVALFEPSGNLHWPGNLKRYRVDPDTDQIVDVNDNPAVDPVTGFFSDSAQSFWSATVDGSDVASGGAANELPAPGSRNVYTYFGLNDSLSHASNRVTDSNANIDDVVLGIGNAGDPSRAQVIEFARGADAADFDGDGNTSEGRNQVGDPLHGRPTTAIYGGTPGSPDIDDAVVYFGTNDGYMHAVDFATGAELWSFIPEEFMATQAALFENDSTANKNYGIDGTPVIQRLDVNGNGIIESGDRVYLYFGMRRGGSFYYALDVTDKTDPQFMWKLDTTSLPGAGQTWSTPLPTRMLVDTGSGQNSDHLVLVIGGGYDLGQDGNTSVTDSEGNAIYIVDSVDGDLLWHASDTGSNRDLSAMRYSIPGDIKVIDIDSDNYADRMYATDMGGQLWRFDIFNGQPLASFSAGGVIAQLGGAPSLTPGATESRRFYYAADSAIVLGEGQAFINIAVGSGHRAHPNSTLTEDSFFSVRDYVPFVPRSQAAFDALTPVTVSDLVDITDDVSTAVPNGAAGWKLWLRASGAFAGEKSLSEARTFNNKIFFTTFQPGSSGAGGCVPQLGVNRLYIVDILTGAPVTNLDGVGDPDNLTTSDRFTEFAGSISSEVVFLFPSGDGGGGGGGGGPPECVGDECDPIFCVGLQCFPPGFLNNPVRTFWSQEESY